MILALDATMKNIGAALFTNDGELRGLSCIQAPQKESNAEKRDLYICQEIDKLIREHGVKEIAVEVTPGFIKSMKAAESIHKAKGMVLMAAATHELKYHPISSYDIKFIAVGRKKNVDKKEMIAAALSLYPVPPLSRKAGGKIHEGKAEHEADAIFVGMAFFAQRKYREAISKEVDELFG
jgi:Holliday junction resolvasome RuvABC endonuclease subunit